jgi:hypothetical protein
LAWISAGMEAMALLYIDITLSGSVSLTVDFEILSLK